LVNRNVRCERALEILTGGVPQQSERSRPKIRSVVDQYVQPPEFSTDLQGYRVDVVLDRNIADDSVRAGMLPCHALNAFAAARDEGYTRPAGEKFMDQR
jgi:hypothetical protein